MTSLLNSGVVQVINTVKQTCFIISTGRCATQWIGSSLGDIYSDLICVEHEPIHNHYCPRKALSSYTFSVLSKSNLLRVEKHMDDIERQLETKDYLECGHPCWSTLPYLLSRFNGRIRVIHLTRHPIPTACSWLTHSAYQVPILPHIPEKILLSPFDDGVQFPHYQTDWEKLNAFEKCLYY
jgi:hypothetical protein